ncbi:hypothetical protein [Yinghuangia sp. YIM S09857]|uniref:hypothetical protein n=1 Tax=Yinghuangia sp. YIM S09857 TaxID=3436929 RepID=UPI003F53272F
MSSYVLPALIAAACTAGIGYAASRALHSRAERRTDGPREVAPTAAMFESEGLADAEAHAVRELVFEDAPAPETAADSGNAPGHSPKVLGGAAAEIASEVPAPLPSDVPSDVPSAIPSDAASDVPAPRIPRQDPAMAALTPPPASAGMPPLRSTTPHPSQALPPMLPPHLTGAHLLGVAARGTAVTAVRSGTAGGLDVFDFADGGSIVVMPSDRDVAELVSAALGEGQDVRLLGTSEVGGGRSLTFQVHESTAFFLADRVYARPAA